MAFYTRKEFAQLAGLKNDRAINVYVQRGKILLSGKLIDDTIEQNKLWLDEQQYKNSDRLELKREQVIAQPTVKKTKSKSKKVQENNTTELPPPPIRNSEELTPIQKRTLSKADIDIKIKKASLEKTMEEIAILKVKKMKMHGELIPTDIVKSLIRELTEGVKIAYLDAMENYTVVISKQKKLTEVEKSNIKKEFTTIINKAVERQSYVANKGLKSIVEEYSQTKGVGERE